MTTNKRKRAASESLAFLLIGAGILLALNLLGLFTSYGRFDATRNRLFSLAPSSERLMEDLDEDMQITAYFSSDLPPQFASTEREVRDLLEEYAQASDGRLSVRFVDPGDDEELKSQAEEDGIEAVQHQLIEAGARSTRMGFRGLVIKYMGDSRTIPVIAGSDGLEYELTMRIKDLVGEKRVVGILAGHGAATLAEDLAPLSQMLTNYELREVSAAQPIDNDEISAVLLVSPSEAIPEAELQNLNTYVMNGGALGIIGGSINLNLEQPPPSAAPVDTGLNALLERWGVRLEQNLVADPQCEMLPMGGMAVPYPFFPRAVLDAEQQEHPAVFGLATVTMPFSASVSVLEDAPAGVRVLPLISSSEGAWVVNDASIMLQPRDPTEWQRTGRVGTRAMAVAIEGTLPSAFPGGEGPAQAATDVRVMVIGAGALFLQAGQGQMTDTLAFALNSVDWLAAEDDLIAIRTKSVAEPGLDQPAALRDAEQRAEAASEARDRDEFAEALEERQAAEDAYKRSQQITQWALTLGLPLLLALFGVIRWRQRIAKKNNIKL
ncbi:MAG: GldG family protein [Sandaracinaceae bacterium]|nr:GldG family protein [Sandaracinaceae bacterium]